MRDLPKPPKLQGDPAGEARLLLYFRDPATQDYLAAANTEYPYWDKLRFKPPPAGLTPEQAWQLVKWSRLSQRQPLPLRDEHDDPFWYWLPPAAFQILHEVDRWGGTSLAIADGPVS